MRRRPCAAYAADPVVRSHPLNRGRLSWWAGLPHLAGGRRWIDIAGGNHAAIYGAPSWGPAQVGRPLQMDGHIAAPQYAVAECPTLAAYTIACRVVFDSLYPPDSGNSNHSLLKNWGGVTVVGYFHWNMVNQGDALPPGTIRCYANATGGVAFGYTASQLSVGVPYYLVATCGGGNLQLYTNGVADGPVATYTGSLSSNASKIAFGTKLMDDQATPIALALDNPMLAGTLGDVSLWDRALSGREVARLYREARAGYPNLLRRRPAAWGIPGPAFRPWYAGRSAAIGTGVY